MYARVMYGNKNMPMNYSCFVCDNADDLQSLPTTKQKSSGNRYPVCCAGSLAYVWEENKTYILNNADVWSFYFDGYKDFNDCCIDDCNDVIAGGTGAGDSDDDEENTTSGASQMIVHVYEEVSSDDGSTYEANVSYEEISEAIEQGTIPVCELNGLILNLSYVNKFEHTILFAGIFYDNYFGWAFRQLKFYQQGDIVFEVKIINNV